MKKNFDETNTNDCLCDSDDNEIILTYFLSYLTRLIFSTLISQKSNFFSLESKAEIDFRIPNHGDQKVGHKKGCLKTIEM
jgi:hypothetical protein